MTYNCCIQPCNPYLHTSSQKSSASSKVHIPALFIPLEVLKPAILEPPVDLFKTARAVVHDGFEETKSGDKSKHVPMPAKVDDIEIVPEAGANETSHAPVYSHSDIASKIMASAASGKPPICSSCCT